MMLQYRFFSSSSAHTSHNDERTETLRSNGGFALHRLGEEEGGRVRQEIHEQVHRRIQSIANIVNCYSLVVKRQHFGNVFTHVAVFDSDTQKV